MTIRWHGWRLKPQIGNPVIVTGIKDDLEFEVRHQDIKSAIELAKNKADRINQEMRNDPS